MDTDRNDPYGKEQTSVGIRDEMSWLLNSSAQ